jgi:hypothetical protein
MARTDGLRPSAPPVSAFRTKWLSEGPQRDQNVRNAGAMEREERTRGVCTGTRGSGG